MTRPTQRDIARLAKVTQATVSLALRGHKSIPVGTRIEIETIAKEIGYRPDPTLSALMSYRREAKPSSHQGTLAWINNCQRPEELRRRFPRYFLGAQERCRELGFQLEEFRMTELNGSFKRLSKVLRARNIQGLLFPPQDRKKHITRASFDWENYSCIAFGFSLVRPQLHVVTNAQFRSTRLAVRKLRSLGYRRIGFVTDENFNERTDRNFLAGFLVEQRSFAAADRIPVHVIPEKKSKSLQEAGFRKWFFRHIPEAILDTGWPTPAWMQALRPGMRKKCGLAFMDISEENTGFAGINQNNIVIGRTAVDMVVSMIHANEQDIPAIPRRTLIEGSWMHGRSAPRINE